MTQQWAFARDNLL